MMALRDCGVALDYINNSDTSRDIIYDNSGENISYDEQADNSEESYMLSASSPEIDHLDQSNQPSAIEITKHKRRSKQNNGSENSFEVSTPLSVVRKKKKSQGNRQCKPAGKKNSNKKLRIHHKNNVKKTVLPKSQKSVSKTQKSKTHSSRSKASQNAPQKGTLLQSQAVEAKQFVPALKLSQLHKIHNTTKTSSHSLAPAASVTHKTVPTTTSILLSMMAQAVSTPKYTSVHTSRSSPSSDYPEYPTRNYCPLLSEMISKPPVTVVSISSAPRQMLSTVQVEPLHPEEPRASVISKLEKEIRCECKFNKGQPCWLVFQEDRLRKERLHHLTLKRESLDLVILAKIAANINREEKTKKYRGRNRQRCRVCYYHEGRQICRETFMFIHGICKGRLCALMQHYKKKGLSVRVHGNKSNTPHHALSYTDSERVLDFIREYANDHCVSSFGRKPGSKAGGGLLIMSPTQSKLFVHHKYKMWCVKNNFRAVSLRSFQNLWTKHLPYIVVLRGSNKTPIPESRPEEPVLELHEHFQLADEMVPTDMAVEKSARLLVSNRTRNTNNVLKNTDFQPDTCIKHVHCGTNTLLDYDSFTDGKKKRKRKGLPQRKIETSSCLSLISAGRGFEHNPIFDDSQVVHASVVGTHSNTRNICDNNDDILQNQLPRTHLHHSMFNSDLHIPQSISSSPLQDQATVSMNFHCRPTAAPMMLTTNKDMMYPYNNKMSISMTKAANLHPALYVQQSSQLLDSYSMQCSDRFIPPISGSHGLGDQSQPVLLPNQSSDFSNIHQIDWQTWQSYSTL